MIAPEKESVRETFELDKAMDHPMVKKYQPKFLAKGGEHIVYEIPGRPDIVVKVEASTMAKIQESNIKNGRPLDAMDPDVLPHVLDIVKNNQERYRRMTEYFGRDHVLGMKQSLVKIPITERIIGTLHRGEPPADAKETKEAWAIVRVQKRAPEFADRSRKSVVAGYAEQREPDAEPYGRVTSALVEGDPKAEYTAEEYRSLLPEQFSDLLRMAEKDEQLSATLREFVENTMAYAEDTGEILDLAGTDNVTVFQKDGKWNYRLVDALYPTGASPKRANMLALSRDAAERSARGEEIDEGEKNVVYNTVNFLRAINGMARQLGVKKQITMVPEGSRGKIDYLKLLTPPEKKK